MPVYWKILTETKKKKSLQNICIIIFLYQRHKIIVFYFWLLNNDPGTSFHDNQSTLFSRVCDFYINNSEHNLPKWNLYLIHPYILYIHESYWKILWDCYYLLIVILIKWKRLSRFFFFFFCCIHKKSMQSLLKLFKGIYTYIKE